MYQVLYRKWRPRVFSDVVGQPHVTKTLASEIEQGRLSHAYLFTGSRGTGKTTCAKILSKAVNCLHPVNGDPCNECEICKGIDNGSILDVVEIDAASNNGVDNIRDIREEVNFTPASCKYRVYIIDEVHMLSAGAFNALLKTLEEPPEHVIFILATTEVHKLPATILSRCQRFDFRRIPSGEMAGRLTYVSIQEGLTLEQDAAMLIARLADGAMRDALSILDQCGTRSKNITTDLVSDVAGLTGRVYLYELARAIMDGDSQQSIVILDKLHNSSCDMERLCSELINHFRNLMIVKTVRHAGDLVICTEQELKQLSAQAEGFTLESILYAIDLLQASMINIRKGVNRRIEMEMTVIRLCNPVLSTDSKAILKRLSMVENAVKKGVPAVKALQPETVAPAEPAKAAETDAKETESPEGTDASAEKPAAESPVAVSDVLFDHWPEVLTELGEINKPLWGILMSSSAYVRGDHMLIKSDNPAFGSFIRTGTNARDLRVSIFNVTGEKYKLGLFKQPVSQAEAKPRDSLENLISKVSGTDIKLTVTE